MFQQKFKRKCILFHAYLASMCVCVCIYLCLCVPEYLYIVREKSQAAFPYVHLMFQLQASSATCRTRFLALNKSYLHPLHISLQFLLAAALVTECIVKALHPQKKKKTAFQSNPNKHLITSRYRVRDGTFGGSGYKVAPSCSSEEEIM